MMRDDVVVIGGACGIGSGVARDVFLLMVFQGQSVSI